MPKKPVPFPSTTRTYGTIAQLENHALRDDLIALAELHDLGRKNNGFTSEQIALYLQSSLDALRQIGPDCSDADQDYDQDDDRAHDAGVTDLGRAYCTVCSSWYDVTTELDQHAH